MDFPDIVPNDFSWGWQDNTQSKSSSLNNAVQHSSMPGGQWRGTLTFANRDTIIDDIAEFKAFLMSLGGPAGRFDLSPPDLNQRGTRLGSGVVSGAGQNGKTLNTSGWNINQAELFRAGDYFSVNGELKMITQTIASDASGNAALVFAPAIRVSPPDLAAIEVVDPRATCYLENPDQVNWQISTGPLIHAISISVIEDVT